MSIYAYSTFLSFCRVCLLGNRSLNSGMFDNCAKTEVVKNSTRTTELWSHFCGGQHSNKTCDEYFSLNNLTEMDAIPGFLNRVIQGEEVARKHSEQKASGISSSATPCTIHIEATGQISSK